MTLDTAHRAGITTKSCMTAKAFRFPMHILEGALKECMDKDAAQKMIEEVQA